MTENPLTPNGVLMSKIDKYQQVVVLGVLNDGKTLDIATNRPTYEFVNYMLNRGLFNINLMENNSTTQAVAAAEKAVEDQVADNMQAEIKERKARGRPRKVK